MAPITSNIIVEAITVGIGLLIIVAIMSQVVLFVKPDLKPELPAVCSTWNSNHMREIIIFASGFFFHLACEAADINRWYVDKKIAERQSI